ncbi:fatty acid desaturase [Legionella quateirensis]|uniref:Fatty acid desaturase n=1 Tax=Legionella quateirensis TaxID=45072 RepID=A0A378KXE4_9GAMM|nr:fatty acid desaturase [Legionella quateirensis]KTD44893.1 Fatty acid desaturase [Legionella quateirensis]STY19484.1 Fatty acid desaturase [Legionella quateirensis]
MKYVIHFLLYTLITGILYSLASNHPIYEPFVINELVIDNYIPMIPQSVYIYMSYFFLLPVLIFVARSKPGFTTVFYIALACGVINVLIYTFVPTRLFERIWAPENSFLAYLQSKDTILCAFPSGHVALPLSIALGAFMIACQKRLPEVTSFWRKVSVFYFIWFCLLASSTLLTKQHFVLDVVSGVLLATIVVLTGMYYLYAKNQKKSLNVRSLWALVSEFSLIALAMTLIIRYWHPVTITLGIVFIASRQHALLALYHDAVHYLISSNKRLNDFIINCFAGVPFFMPVHGYRSLHFSHHQHLGTVNDPEKRYLYRNQPWNYQALNSGLLLKQLLGDLLLWNSLRMLWLFIKDRISHNNDIKLPVTSYYNELYFQFMFLFVMIGISYQYWPSAVIQVLFLWFLPYLTVTQLLQKIRSFAEHAPMNSDADSGSCSWSPGWLGSFFIWPYNINYHKEHHRISNISWDELPKRFSNVEQRPGKSLIQHIWSVNK